MFLHCFRITFSLNVILISHSFRFHGKFCPPIAAFLAIENRTVVTWSISLEIFITAPRVSAYAITLRILISVISMQHRYFGIISSSPCIRHIKSAIERESAWNWRKQSHRRCRKFKNLSLHSSCAKQAKTITEISFVLFIFLSSNSPFPHFYLEANSPHR